MLTSGHCWGYYPGTLSSLPSLCNSIEDWVPVYKIYGYPIFKWVAQAWLKIGYQESSLSNGHQGDILHWVGYQLVMEQKYMQRLVSILLQIGPLC